MRTLCLCCVFLYDKMNFKSLLLSLILSSASFLCFAKLDVAKPLPEIKTLAGTYAELRPNHFHGGWDFRTDGQENLPVYSVADGYIARVVITPSGYGKMVMINHPGGITTVYGHLNGFMGKLDTVVRKAQYEQKKYDVTVEFKPSDFPVKKGQQFALSGNTGGSAGPHLHFETRRTSDGTMLNPVEYNSVFGVEDREAPKIYGVKIYGLSGRGEVNGVQQMKYITNAAGATLRQGSTVNAWGEIAFCVKASDYMTGTSFHYGVRKLRLSVDGTVISEIHIQNFKFSDKRAVNSLVDFYQLMTTKEYFVKFSKDKGNPLPVYVKQVKNGILSLREEGRRYKVMIEVEDDFGNTNSLSFIVKATQRPFPAVDDDYTNWFKAGHTNTFSRKNMLLNLSKDALYTDVPIKYSEEPSKKYFSSVYDFDAEYTPLHVPADISVRVERDSLSNKSQYVLAKLNNKNLVVGVYPAKYVKGHMVGTTTQLGRFAVYKDDKAPTIGTEHILKLRQFPVMKLKIRDNLSGIDTYDGYIDGKWVLFEYDPKNSRILCDLRKAGLAEHRKHSLKVVVTDYCGNQGVLETSIFY